MTTVYISAHKVEDARRLRDKILTAGHKVVSTWHDAEGPTDPKWCGTAKQRADRNFSQIRSAGVYVMIADPEHVAGTNRVTGGKFVELGYALGRADGDRACGDDPDRVCVVGGVENGMIGEGVVELFDTEEAFVGSL